jgi:pyrroline-5-carboxylate reductase
MSRQIVLVGCGKMGGALLEGWIACGISCSDITVIEPFKDAAERLMERHPLSVLLSPEEIGENISPDIVIFAIKPQCMDGVIEDYRRFVRPECLFVSIAAGKPVGYFESRLGRDAAIVRVMPNTPASIRRAISVAFPNALVANAQIKFCSTLLEAVGEVAWIDDESLLDAVTALSGSGPAYVFLLSECMAEAAIKAGLPEDLAKRLAQATVSGAAELMHLSDLTPEILRKNVTSPGGTTAEALDILMAPDGLRALMDKAIAAATKRSKELAG